MNITTNQPIPKITISPFALSKIYEYSKLSKDDIFFICEMNVEQKKDATNVYIGDVFLTPQDVLIANSTLDANVVFDLLKVNTYVDANSIVYYGVGKTKCASSVAQGVNEFNHILPVTLHMPYFVYITVNKKYELQISFTDSLTSVRYNELPYDVDYSVLAETDDIKIEIEQYATRKPVTYSGYSYTSPTIAKPVEEVYNPSELVTTNVSLDALV